MKNFTKLKLFLLFAVIFIIGESVSAQQRPGRKFRVRDYEIQFGQWPLMEVTKLSKRPPPVKFSALGGFMENAIHSNINYNKIPQGIKFRGPPPSFQNNKPQIFAQFKPPQLSPPQGIPIQGPPPLPTNPGIQQPILIKGPPPPGLAPLPLLPQQPYQFQFPTTTTPAPKEEVKADFSTVMGNAAYSGFFSKKRRFHNPISNLFSSHNRPPPPLNLRGRPYFPPPSSQQNFRPGPVFYPQPQMITGDVAPAASERFEMNKVPNVPPVIKIGNNPPEGYVMTHGEQQLITLKLPDVKMSERMDPYDLLQGAEYRHSGGSRRQDLFNQRPVSVNNKNIPGKHKEDKQLPDVGAIYTLNMILQTPNISAPMNGSDSPHFQKGMDEMHRIYGNAKKQSPLDSQVKLLGKLFTELTRLKPPKVNVEEEPQILRRDGSDPFGDHSVQYYTKPKIDAPLMAVHIQSYTVPDPSSGDPDVLESARMFGLQGHRIEFGNTNEIINLMDTAQKSVSKRIPVEDLGFTRGEVNHNLQEWIKGYISLTRKMKDQAHSKGEEIANTSFRQHQNHMRMWDGRMEQMDPKMFSQGASITNAGAVAAFQG